MRKFAGSAKYFENCEAKAGVAKPGRGHIITNVSSEQTEASFSMSHLADPQFSADHPQIESECRPRRHRCLKVYLLSRQNGLDEQRSEEHTSELQSLRHL